MKRYPHYWWKLKGTKFPSRICVLDCDSLLLSDPNRKGVQTDEMTRWTLTGAELRRGIAVSIRRYAGDTVHGLWYRISTLVCSKDRTWVFCSPASRILPLIGFWDRLESADIRLAGSDWRMERDVICHGEDRRDGICIVEDPPTVIACELKDRPGRLIILDVRNFGIDLLPSELSADERCNTYLSGLCDCVSTLRETGSASLRCTAASQAVQQMRTFDECIQLHCHTHKRALKIERDAYFGGRCECYRLGDIPGPVYHLDVRSMYPSLCLTLPVPVSLRRYYDDEREAARVCEERPEDCAANVRVRVDYPLFPLRQEWGTIYPIGQFDTALCGPELRRAVRGGFIRRVYNLARYHTTAILAPFYRRWLALLESARANHRVMECQWIKRLMNALVGKFGEPGRRWIPARYRPEHEDYTSWYESDPDGAPARFKQFPGHTMMEEVNDESYWSIPAIAAWITSAGRDFLWDRLSLGWQKDVYYCDTDSIICGQATRDALQDGGHIREGDTGYLRTLGTHSRCVVHGIRHYELDETVVCAGVPKGLIENGESRESYFHRAAIATEVSLGRAPRAERARLTYPAAETYQHGIVDADGRVTPLRRFYE